MIVPVILSGGSGTRLWPMSRELYPKQFHHLLGNETMLQQTVQRLDGLCQPEQLIVIGNREHRFMIIDQLAETGWQDANVLLEPVGRNTAPAVAMAAFAALEMSKEVTLLVLAADHVIRDPEGFRAAVKAMLPLAEDGKLITFGIPANRPDTGFGYIHCGEKISAGAFHVDAFVEKPDKDRAAEYVAAEDYYWNSGMFLFQAKTYLTELELWQPEILDCCQAAWVNREQHFHGFQAFDEETFGRCPAISIDCAVMEKTNKAVMAPLDVGWNDVGSWSALYQELEQDEHGNATKGDVLLMDTHGCLLYANDRLLVTSGLKDIVIVETSDALLVADRNQSHEIGVLAKELQNTGRREASLHRCVFRPWGSYTVLEKSSGHQIKRLTLKPGAVLSLQRHKYRAEHWVVVKGQASIVQGEEKIFLNENESTYIPAGTIHQLANYTENILEVIEVQTGSYLEEDDIERLDDPYHRGGTSG
ncbi:MAG: mannose-1-phosphate guanylyltransferase/mannose-6-phosphate isomerase [Gammaproteobacteria bacterium]|nr:mannose-1-phosphate guanylyltransferase/mannose-6-phosphate isomerase [Gammaproteobacteria bacterium]